MLKLTPERIRRARIIALNAVFGLVVFAIALSVWFPYGRAKEVAISMAAAQDLDVEIGSAGPVLGLGVTFKDIRVSTRPPTGKPTRFIVDTARVTVSPFSLLMLGSPRTVSLSMDAFGGRIDVEQKGSPGKKGPFRLEVRVRDLNLKEIPGIREAVNVPVNGTLNGELDIVSTTGRYGDGNGSLSFSCESCVIGDGKTPLKVEGNPFLAGGLTLPRLRLGTMGGHVKIEKGTAKLQGVEAKSPDGELALEGEVSLRDPLPLSMVNAYLRFKLTEPFLKTAENLRTILQMAAASGKRPDGWYGMRLGGSFARLSPPVFTTTSPIAPSLPPGRPAGRAAIAPAFGPPGSPPASTPSAPVPQPSVTFPPPPPPPPAAAEAPPAPPPAAPPPAPEPIPGPNPEAASNPSAFRGVPPPAAAAGADIGAPAAAPPPATPPSPPPQPQPEEE